jgi:DNA polymerase III alpha subunit
VAAVTPPPAVLTAADNEPIVLAGELVTLDQRITKQRNPWAVGVLHCADGDVPIEVWPVPYVICGENLTQGCTVEITGRVDKRDRLFVRVTTVTPAGREVS